MLAIQLNGELRQIQAQQTVADLVTELELANQTIAIAINRQIVPRSSWTERQLCADDKVEVVRAIGGG